MPHAHVAPVVRGDDGQPVQLIGGGAGYTLCRTDLPVKLSPELAQKLCTKIREIHRQFPIQGKAAFAVDPAKQQPVPRWA